MAWPYVLFAFAAGAALPVQFGINAQLSSWLDSPVRAAFVSFLTGAIILAVAAALLFKPLPSGSRLGHAPWWVWAGGAFGAFYVVASGPRHPGSPADLARRRHTLDRLRNQFVESLHCELEMLLFRVLELRVRETAQ